MKLSDYFYIILGTAIMAVGIVCIYDQIGLVTGGFTGLSIVVKSITEHWIKGGVPLWVTNLSLNIPVFFISFFCMSRRFIGRTLFGTMMLSLWLAVIGDVDLAQGDYLLGALFGGVFSGTGLGFVLKAKATTGGTDMVAALVHKKLRTYSVVQIMQVLDGLIVLAGFLVFGIRPTMYAFVAIFVATKVSDGFLEGFDRSKAAVIITNEYQKVAESIMDEMERGVTGIEARGMYTNDNKCILYCVVTRKEMVSIKEIVHNADPKAFVIVSDAREVLGEGFLEYPVEL